MSKATQAVPVLEFTPEQVALIKSQIAKDATDDELKLFLYVAKKVGLDPMSRQIYCIHRGKGNNKKMTIQTSIDGFRVVASRSGDYAGQGEPEWTEDEQNPGFPMKCKVPVYKFKGNTRYEAAVGVALFKEYAQWDNVYGTNENGHNVITGKKLGEMWARMPHTMLAKVAEALALRKAFPQDLIGIYTAEEMAQADKAEQQPAQQAPVKNEQQPPLELPAATTVPFTPTYTTAPEPVPAQQQQAAPAQQQQAPPPPAQQQPAPTTPITPFTQTYTNPNVLVAVLPTATNEKQLEQLYRANKELCKKYPAVIDRIAERKAAILNGGKLHLTGEQYTQLCNKIARECDTKAYDNALQAYVLSGAQQVELQRLHKDLMDLEAACARTYQYSNDVENLLGYCRTDQQVKTLQAANQKMVTQVADLQTKLNAKLATFKAQAA